MGSEDGGICLWDTNKAKGRVMRFEGHAAPVFSVSCISQKKRIVSCSVDGVVKIWYVTA